MNRKPIFDAIKAERGKPFSLHEVAAVDALLDSLGFAEEQDAFTKALAVVLKHEGGYVNHPKDPGGRTNLGVTQRVWEAWTGKPASEAIMRSLTRDMVAPLYRKNYWDAVKADELPPALALCVFDMAVNAGPSRAVKILQTALGVAVDGKIGPQTIASIKTWGVRALVNRYQEGRRAFYRGLSTFGTFGKGWLRRVDEVEDAALEML